MTHFDDEIKDDPRDVDDLLSKELLNLSMQDRNAINEEIHGVHCLAVEETPELLNNLLRNLAFVLDNVLSEAETRAYRQSQKLPYTYVNTVEFRLRFLRCEVFDAKKAAKRMAFFLNTVQDLFGDFALERPIRLSDFNKEEQTFMRKGHYQWLPFRDRSGRRIAVIFPGEKLAAVSGRLKVRLQHLMTRIRNRKSLRFLSYNHMEQLIESNRSSCGSLCVFRLYVLTHSLGTDSKTGKSCRVHFLDGRERGRDPANGSCYLGMVRQVLPVDSSETKQTQASRGLVASSMRHSSLHT